MSFLTETTNLNGNTFKLGDSVQHNDGSHCIVVSIREPHRLSKIGCVELGVVLCGTESFRWQSMGNFSSINGEEIK